jgi:hypothetical protein
MSLKRHYGLLLCLVTLFAILGRAVAQPPSAIDQLQSDTALHFVECYLIYKTANITADTYDLNGRESPKTKAAYKEAHECTDKAKQEAEARFAAARQELSSKDSAVAALKEAYIFWRAEMSLGTSTRSYDQVLDEWRAHIERVRVEMKW